MAQSAGAESLRRHGQAEVTDPQYPDASLATEAVLIATFGAQQAWTPVPAEAALPPAAFPPASLAAAEAPSPSALLSPASDTALPAPTVTAVQPSAPNLPLVASPALAMVSNVAEVAQVTAPAAMFGAMPASAAPASAAPGGDTSFWPEGHWESDADAGGWGGLMMTGASLGGVVLMVGTGLLFWRSINSKPEFEHAIVIESFTERPCGETVYVPAKYAVVYEYEDGKLLNPPKDTDGDKLTFSILENTTDDSSLVTINPDTGEVSFINDPQVGSTGDLNRDGTYVFTIKVEDTDGFSDRQVVNLEIKASPFTEITQTDSFLMHGGSVCADIVNVASESGGQYLEEISTGKGNDWVKIAGDGSFLGIELGEGEDTLAINEVSEAVSADLGTGRDTVDINAHVESLTLFNFDGDDLIDLRGIATSLKQNPKDGVVLYDSETAALETALAAGQALGYQNGEDTFIVVGPATLSTDAATTLKLEDVVLTDYSQILV